MDVGLPAIMVAGRARLDYIHGMYDFEFRDDSVVRSML